MIVVTGATGQLGRLVAERLVERVPPGQGDPPVERLIGRRSATMRDLLVQRHGR